MFLLLINTKYKEIYNAFLWLGGLQKNDEDSFVYVISLAALLNTLRARGISVCSRHFGTHSIN